MKSFLTGSRVYGAPKPDSDYDLVVFADADVVRQLRMAAGVKTGEPIRFGVLNLIPVSSEAEYDAWHDATAQCLVKASVDGPLTRDEAVAIHKPIRTERKVLHGNPS